MFMLFVIWIGVTVASKKVVTKEDRELVQESPYFKKLYANSLKGDSLQDLEHLNWDPKTKITWVLGESGDGTGDFNAPILKPYDENLVFIQTINPTGCFKIDPTEVYGYDVWRSTLVENNCALIYIEFFAEVSCTSGMPGFNPVVVPFETIFSPQVMDQYTLEPSLDGRTIKPSCLNSWPSFDLLETAATWIYAEKQYNPEDLAGCEAEAEPIFMELLKVDHCEPRLCAIESKRGSSCNAYGGVSGIFAVDSVTGIVSRNFFASNDCSGDVVHVIPGERSVNSECNLRPSVDFDTVDKKVYKRGTLFSMNSRKTLWEDCTAPSSWCEAGTVCEVKNPYYSQCVEDTAGYSTPYEKATCVKTNNGPWDSAHIREGVKHWGCSAELPCCNPSAVCQNNQCMLTNALDAMDTIPSVFTLPEQESSGSSKDCNDDGKIVAIAIASSVAVLAIAAITAYYLMMCKHRYVVEEPVKEPSANAMELQEVVMIN